MALKQNYIFSKSVILVTKNSHFNIKIRMLKQYDIIKKELINSKNFKKI